jgi:hypothetical protein
LERWYQEWNGIVDSLLLSDISLFDVNDKESRKLIRYLFRVVFHMAMHNVDQVTSHWKEFTGFFWNNVSDQVTISEPKLSKYNPFRALLESDTSYRRIYREGLRTKNDASAVAHLISTRQMVPGSIGVQVKALDKFVSTTSVEFRPTDVNLERAELFAGFVGRKICDLGKTKNLTALNHISLSTAGDVDFPKSKGGRGAAINAAITEILGVIPAESGDLALPFGITVREVAGKPRYCTWGRPTNLVVRKVVPSSDPRWVRRAIMLEAPVYGFGGQRADFNPEIEGNKECYEGYDEYLGLQIFYCALYTALIEGYIDLEGNALKPVPASTSVVPEPGGKARVVTTTKWWVQVLEQPFGHLMKALLSGHPSAESGLKRADQAWLYLNLLHNVEQIPNGYLLSSDLEEATDAIAPLVADRMVTGFVHKIYGYIPEVINIGIKIGLRLTREITVRFPRSSGRPDVTFIKRRGVLMGEPVTKSVLTLYSLVCEEAAIRDYLYNFQYSGVSSDWELSLTVVVHGITKKYHVRKGHDWNWALNCIATLPKSRQVRVSVRQGSTGPWTSMKPGQIDRLLQLLGTTAPSPRSGTMFTGDYESSETFTGPVSVPWRAFAVGGDDHIAHGPVDYLKLITSNHYAFGSKISEPKHGYSNVAVKFCEKILFLRGRDYTIPPWKVNNSYESYEASVWVDSIKVRLLSPLTKSMDCENDRNTAIGKSGGISRTLSWLQFPEAFTTDWIDMVNYRFTSRMYPYLPFPNGKNERIFNNLKLPREFGGLGLARTNESIAEIIQRCPVPTRYFAALVSDRYLGHDIVVSEAGFAELARAFCRLCTANSARGIDQRTTVDDIEKFLMSRKSYSLTEASDLLGLPKMGNRRLYTELKNAGYYPIDAAVEAMSRPGTFLDALRGKKRISYATSSWRQRYQKLWSVTEAVLGRKLDPNFRLSEEQYSTINSVNSITDFFPQRLYNLYELIPERPVSNLAGKSSLERSAFFAKFDKIAMQFAKGGKGSMAGASKTLIELYLQRLPDLNLRLDFQGKRVEHSRPVRALPSESDGEVLAQEFLGLLPFREPDIVRNAAVIVIDDGDVLLEELSS